jgi:hypothetical protein
MPGAAVRRRPPNSPTHHPEASTRGPPSHLLDMIWRFSVCVSFFLLFLYTQKTQTESHRKTAETKTKTAPPPATLLSRDMSSRSLLGAGSKATAINTHVAT